MSRPIETLVLRHVAFEDLGAFAPLLHSRGPVRIIDVGVDDLAGLDPLAPDLLVVLGGPIGVYEDAIYPWLADETQFIARRLAADRPTFGICLGAQLIAKALGARVYPSGLKEIGLQPIALTPAGAASCLAPYAAEPLALHWHGDTFDLPEGARLLASTRAVRNQAFDLGPRILGVQFHPEAGGPGFERWLIGHAIELSAARVDTPALRVEVATAAPRLAAKAEAVLRLWLTAAGLE